jgi:hypothetical protein
MIQRTLKKEKEIDAHVLVEQWAPYEHVPEIMKYP